MVSQQNQPFCPMRPQMMFDIVQEHFRDLRHVKRGRTYVSGFDALYRVPELRKWFRNEINLSTALDPKRYLRMFRSISKTFGTLNEEELVFRALMHYIGVPKLRKWFHNEINHSTPLDLKRWLRMFRSISKAYGTSNEEELVFRG